MIPIKYRTLQDLTNQWYDYNQKMWANAVVVKESVREKYKNAQSGTEILEDDILAYFVWIPRYRYQLWNVESNDSTPRSIEIEFESITTPISTGSTNNTWLTHPGFCIGRTGDPTVTVGNYGTDRNSCSGTEVNGFWVGKFEPSNGSINETNEVKTSGIMIKPEQISLTYQDSVNQFQTAWSVQTQYGFSSNYISRVIRNTEWGAVTYLAHSKYGVGTDKIRINNTAVIGKPANVDERGASITGCTYKNNQAITYNATSCENENTVAYNDLSTGVLASTNGNIYGIYDMAGGSMDRVAATKENSSGTQTENDGEFYGKVDEKYYDLYAYGSNSFDYGRGRLGDATKEIIDMTNAEEPVGWYYNQGTLNFLKNNLTDIFIRGGAYYNGVVLESTVGGASIIPASNDIITFGQHNSAQAYLHDTFRIVVNKQ